MTFTAHNILLPDGSQTIPEADWFIADSPWTQAALRTLRLVYGGDLRGRSIADLGCLEGGYALAFAQAGLAATGIEVRQSNYENCILVRDRFRLPNLSFVKDDVWSLTERGPFDALFCCGLLYHLDRPAAFVRLMGARTRDVVILHTHFASEVGDATPVLSALTENESLPGRWYHEHNLDDPDELEKHKWTSWSNKRSFWLTRPAILQVLIEAGFDMVYEQYDMLGRDIRGSMESGYHKQQDRSMFVGVRTARSP